MDGAATHGNIVGKSAARARARAGRRAVAAHSGATGSSGRQPAAGARSRNQVWAEPKGPSNASRRTATARSLRTPWARHGVPLSRDARKSRPHCIHSGVACPGGWSMTWLRQAGRNPARAAPEFAPPPLRPLSSCAGAARPQPAPFRSTAGVGHGAQLEPGTA